MFLVLLILRDVLLCVVCVYILSVVLFSSRDGSCEYDDWDVMPNSLVDGYLHFKPAIPIFREDSE